MQYHNVSISIYHCSALRSVEMSASYPVSVTYSVSVSYFQIIPI